MRLYSFSNLNELEKFRENWAANHAIWTSECHVQSMDV
jgi:hypothetical protein